MLRCAAIAHAPGLWNSWHSTTRVILVATARNRLRGSNAADRLHATSQALGDALELYLTPLAAIDDFVRALHLWRWHRAQRNQPHGRSAIGTGGAGWC